MSLSPHLFIQSFSRGLDSRKLIFTAHILLRQFFPGLREKRLMWTLCTVLQLGKGERSHRTRGGDTCVTQEQSSLDNGCQGQTGHILA